MCWGEEGRGRGVMCWGEEGGVLCAGVMREGCDVLG